jgi:hypothetical protein
MSTTTYIRYNGFDSFNAQCRLDLHFSYVNRKDCLSFTTISIYKIDQSEAFKLCLQSNKIKSTRNLKSMINDILRELDQKSTRLEFSNSTLVKITKHPIKCIH